MCCSLRVAGGGEHRLHHGGDVRLPHLPPAEPPELARAAAVVQHLHTAVTWADSLLTRASNEGTRRFHNQGKGPFY